ncbi:MAG TPA: NAD(P)/FAD-dependent oxidoreductase [Pyrinomonadaceae bacterium]|nr:NAD(P)/FAD-dependent oxidoreductase [Pyrinomonadaceae bacterium]
MPPKLPKYDAIVIGAGPNGLAAAIAIARAGHSVCLFEAGSTVGGGTRSAELTLPGFVHDVCSAVHPLAAASPFFTQLPLQNYGLEFVFPPAALAHPFDDGTALILEQSLDRTVERLGHDGAAYKKIFAPLVAGWDDLSGDVLGPIGMPRHPFAMARFGLSAIRPAKSFAEAKFKEDKTRTLFAGLAAHSFLSLDQPGTTAFGLMLGILAHVAGWPITRGGSQSLANALASHFTELGGEIITDHRVESLKDLPAARAILCDVTPRQLARIAGDSLTSGFRSQLDRYRYGPAAFKLDWALSEPVPWKAAGCRTAATVHLGGSFAEILESEWNANHHKRSEKPFTLIAQPSLFDSTRAPNGQHTLWAYCHVPNGSTFDMAEAIENQIERFAPGFRDCILGRSVITPGDYENYNPNLVGGDINGGIQDLAQMFLRPTRRMYSTSMKNLYLCSSSTPPGGGVHGLCGYHAAQVALRKSLR